MEQFSLQVTHEGKIVQKARNKKNQKKRENVWVFIGFVGDIGLSTVVPIAAGGYIGSILDTKYATYPQYTHILLIAGCFISIIGFVHIIKAIINRIN